MIKIGSLLLRLRARFIDRSSSPSSSSLNLESSKVESMPYTLPFGIFKLVVVTTSSIGLGAFLAKEAAEFLRNNKIFIPSEKDD
uniref:Essential MCU regulator, mitochondrial n=1 Tax=Setaria digitata TaxID=48799 RepID=A0A915PKJ3_9BILA